MLLHCCWFPSCCTYLSRLSRHLIVLNHSSWESLHFSPQLNPAESLLCACTCVYNLIWLEEKPQTLDKLHYKFKDQESQLGPYWPQAITTFITSSLILPLSQANFHTPSLLKPQNLILFFSLKNILFPLHWDNWSIRRELPLDSPSLVPSYRYYLPDIQLCLLPVMNYLNTLQSQPLYLWTHLLHLIKDIVSNFPLSLPYYWSSSLLDHS